MPFVRDDPQKPDEGFAELYARLPDATDLWPWLELARAAAAPVLYLGIGAGRLAVPLHDAGIELVGVDSHPGMLDRLHARLPHTELVRSRIEELALRRKFDLVIAPSNILYVVQRLRAAASHVATGGFLAIELANPHWLRAGAGNDVRVTAFDGNGATLEIDYGLPDGSTVTQLADVGIVWPEEVENWLSGAGLSLVRMFGQQDEELKASPSFFVVAAR
jgi:trans-aconitate methyltransferase